MLFKRKGKKERERGREGGRRRRKEGKDIVSKSGRGKEGWREKEIEEGREKRERKR